MKLFTVMEITIISADDICTSNAVKGAEAKPIADVGGSICEE